jgi:crotonobetainyl-CoA:carnitine CoA-transferase CaiB-like acyl-CoA transferase
MRPPIGVNPTALKVLDLGRYLAGPVVATLLGDLGAEVVKVERPRVGDLSRHVQPQPPDDPGMSYEWQIEGRNKRSITLRLDTPRGADLLRRLAGWADVLVENFRPGLMDEWALGYQELAEVNPRLVYVSVSGFGATGPYRERLGFDYAASAFGGLTYTNGFLDRPPVTTGYPIADFLAGTFGALGVLEAIRRRDGPGGTGRGDWIDLGLYEPILRFSTPWLALYDREGRVRERESSIPRPDDQAPLTLWGYVYETADHGFVAMVPVQHDDAAQRRLWTGIGRADIGDDQRFATRANCRVNYKAADAVLREWCASMDRTAAIATLTAAEIPCAPVNSAADLAADPHVRERNLVEVLDHRGQPLLMPGVVPRLAGNPGQVRWAGEELGASNRDVYCGLLGLGANELDELVSAGIV